MEDLFSPVNCWSCNYSILDIANGMKYLCRKTGEVLGHNICHICRPTSCKYWTRQNIN